MRVRSDRIQASKVCEECRRAFTRDDKPGVIYSAFIALRFCSPECSAASSRLDPAENFWTKVEKTDTCWLWQGGTSPKGYGVHWIGNGHKRAHRYAYELATGTDPGANVVMHMCDVRNCVNPAHLRLGTQTENIADMDRKRRRGAAKGERHHAALISREQVLAIRADNRPSRQIAASGDFPIGRSGIAAIKSGRTWRDL